MLTVKQGRFKLLPACGLRIRSRMETFLVPLEKQQLRLSETVREFSRGVSVNTLLECV